MMEILWVTLGALGLGMFFGWYITAEEYRRVRLMDKIERGENVCCKNNER